MKTNWKVSLVAVIATIMSMGAVAAEKTFNIGGDAEYDITHQKNTAKGASSSTKSFTESGRIKLNAKARIDQDNGSFVEAVVQPLFGFSNGRNTATDDTYIKFGKKAWDIQLGRFEGIDLFPLGKDTVANKADGSFGYTGNVLRGRDTGVDKTYDVDGDSDTTSDARPVTYLDGHPVQGAAHFNIGKTQIELGAVYGEKSGTKGYGVRPVVKFDAGRFRIAAGYEYGKCKEDGDSTTTGACDTSGDLDFKTKGFGITAGTKVRSFDANFNIAQGKVSGTDSSGTSFTNEKKTSYGVNMTRGRFGAGYVHDKQSGDAGGKEDLFYTAYTVPLMGTKDARVTFAASTAKAKYNDGSSNAKDTSLRARFNYDF